VPSSLLTITEVKKLIEKVDIELRRQLASKVEQSEFNLLVQKVTADCVTRAEASEYIDDRTGYLQQSLDKLAQIITATTDPVKTKK